MANILEYALMAGGAYQTTRAPINLFPVSQNWISFNDQSRDSGFEAVSFTKGSEIVIAYAGTYPKSIGDQLANTGLATGFGSIQLFQAVEYYLQVKTANPGSTITLTGHSLGGGLASLVGVFFGVQAQTFDQAPFAQTALYGGAELLDYLAGKNLYTADTLLPLSSYIAQRQNSGNLIPNSSLVSNTNVQGEFLSGAPWTVFDRIGTPPQTIGTTSPGVSAFDMHSQALLTAFLQSIQTAATGKGLADVTFKLNDLLKMIFDDKLFAFTTDKSNTTNENFLERIVKHEAGVGVAIPKDDMVTRFTADLWKLAKDNGLTLTDGNAGFFSSATNNISKALTAFAMQMYYEDTVNATDPNKQLFTEITGGIQLDIADVSKKFAAAFAANEKLNLKDAKGFDLYFKNYLASSSFTGTERQLIESILPYVRDWYVQAGSNGLAYTDIQNRGAFMLGGGGSDALVGGTAADLLVGNAGDDLLMGGKGNDILMGGKGNDTYIYQTADGLDTILDNDGIGSIKYDGDTLIGGSQYGDNRVYRSADKKHLYVLTSTDGSNTGNSTLLINNQIVVQSYNKSRGDLGLTYTDAPTQSNPSTTKDIKGDLKPQNFGTDQNPSYQTDPQTGNLIAGTEADPDRIDTLYDSAANDHITSGGGNDDIYLTKGADNWVEAGAGRDWVRGGAGKDLMEGGVDADIYYQLSSCLRPCLLGKTLIRYPKKASKASPEVSASCKRTKSNETTATNSIADCARKQGVRDRFNGGKQPQNNQNLPFNQSATTANSPKGQTA